eukprot:12427772-Karenia_brevis.AAC.1
MRRGEKRNHIAIEKHSDKESQFISEQLKKFLRETMTQLSPHELDLWMLVLAKERITSSDMYLAWLTQRHEDEEHLKEDWYPNEKSLTSQAWRYYKEISFGSKVMVKKHFKSVRKDPEMLKVAMEEEEIDANKTPDVTPKTKVFGKKAKGKSPCSPNPARCRRLLGRNKPTTNKEDGGNAASEENEPRPKQPKLESSDTAASSSTAADSSSAAVKDTLCT